MLFRHDHHEMTRSAMRCCRMPRATGFENPVVVGHPLAQLFSLDGGSGVRQDLCRVADEQPVFHVREIIKRLSLRLQLPDMLGLFGDALLLRFHGALANHHGLREDGHVIIRVRGWDVAASPANLRQHLVSHPAFEIVGLRLAGCEDESVEAGFGDDCPVRVSGGSII